MTKGIYERTPEIRAKISASLTGRTVDDSVLDTKLAKKTRCKRGHMFSNENTYVMPGGSRRGKRVCKTCRRVRIASYRERHPERAKAATRGAFLKRTYSISVEDYDSLLELQGYACAICDQKDTSRRLAVDHDHKTGKVRGLLCGLCNRAVGNLRDDHALFQRAIEYLVVP